MKRPGLMLSIYRVLSPLAAALAHAAAPFSAKLARGLAGRRGALERLVGDQALTGCFWFHASSVGEYEQARPVIAALRAAGHGPIAVTHFSPSGMDYAREHPSGDVHDFLPLDTPNAMARLVAAWRPRALVCVKYDGWPNQVLAAEAAGVPVILVSGSLPPDAGRLAPWARPLLRDLYDRFAVLGVGSAADRDRFVRRLGVTAPVVVSGDTRAEQVVHRFRTSADGPVAARLQAWGDRRLVLGSTWPPDEEIWLPVLSELLSGRDDLNIVIVPHEPSTGRLTDLEQALDRLDLPHARLSALDTSTDARCLLVDRIGVLAEIYHAATLAYVGGSFTTGVHSTLEPAVAGVPVLFGPRIANAEEALSMVTDGGGFVTATPAAALDSASALLDDDDARRQAGEAAAAVVTAQLGATERSLTMILEAVSGQR